MILLIFGVLALVCGVGMQFATVEMHIAGLVLLGFAIGLLVLGVLRLRHRAVRLQLALQFGMSCAVIALMIAMATISGCSEADWERAEQADYAVILGCHVDGETPSRTLRERLDLTLELMERNPNVTVIVSGSRGGNEGIEEGTAMARYLEAHGADMSRVIPETEARNTRENLIYSMRLIDERGGVQDGLVIVTSDFHVMRSKWIAASLGLEASGLGCRTTPYWTRQFDLCREVLAFVKAIAIGI